MNGQNLLGAAPAWAPPAWRPPELLALGQNQAATGAGGYSIIDSPIASFIVDATIVSSAIILARLAGLAKQSTWQAIFWAVAAAAGVKGLGDLARMHE
jgi:hypothetical protein